MYKSKPQQDQDSEFPTISLMQEINKEENAELGKLLTTQ